jgi:hypothetical protein
MFAKKGPERSIPGAHTPKDSLARLYERRSAVDALIASLEEYDRYRSKRLDQRKRKSA